MNSLLETGLLLAALGQFLIAMLNFVIIPLMHWQEDLDRMPLLLRQVFHVHCWFIAGTLIIFSTLTCRFAGPMTSSAEPVYRWIAALIGSFWAIRAVLQFAYYSGSHWRGIPSRTTVHIILMLVYPAFAIVYLTAAMRR
jgi:hypothetical protein